MHRSTRNFLHSIWHSTWRWTGAVAALVLLSSVATGTAIADAGARLSTSPSAPAAPAIVVRTVKSGLHDPAAFTFAPSGTIFFLERGDSPPGVARLRTYSSKTKKLRNIYRISGVDGSGERGALGIALSPGWP